jgi:hypothetical protein
MGHLHEKTRDVLEGEKDTVTLRVWLLIDSDIAVDHGDDTISELDQARECEKLEADDKKATTNLLMDDGLCR